MRVQVMLNTSRFVAEAGGQAELVLRVRQATNPNFAFLKPDHRLHPYFRWLLHARPQVTLHCFRFYTLVGVCDFHHFSPHVSMSRLGSTHGLVQRSWHT